MNDELTNATTEEQYLEAFKLDRSRLYVPTQLMDGYILCAFAAGKAAGCNEILSIFVPPDRQDAEGAK